MRETDIPVVMNRVSDGNGTGDVCQVVIYNDNHNSCEHVLRCLMSIFGHSSGLAEKIMMEAHTKGKAIAQVENFGDALRHTGELKKAGLGAEVQSITSG